MNLYIQEEAMKKDEKILQKKYELSNGVILSEAMADPSYLGQISVFSFCLIENYGIPAPKGGDFFMSKA